MVSFDSTWLPSSEPGIEVLGPCPIRFIVLYYLMYHTTVYPQSRYDPNLILYLGLPGACLGYTRTHT